MQPTSHPHRRSIVRLIILLLVLAAAIWVVINRQFVIDTATVWRHPPAHDIAVLATRAEFSDKAKFLFYASLPEINDRDTFNARCRQLVEKTAILGCYINRHIYIFNVTDTRLDGIREVTAAHEMLHAAYDRLSTAERQRIDTLVTQQAAKIDDPKLKARLALYDQTEPGERLNELHSILGSEISNLSNELETYYRQYFVERSKLVALSNKYEAVFNQVEGQQNALVSELNLLANQVETDSVTYTNVLKTLQADINDFNLKAQAGGFRSQTEFNAERSLLVARQAALQAKRDAINAMIATYSQKKSQLDALNVQAEDLQKSINTTTLPEAPTI